MPQEVHIHSLVQEEHQSLAHHHEPMELHIHHVHVVQQAGAKCGHSANHAHVLRCFDLGPFPVLVGNNRVYDRCGC